MHELGLPTLFGAIVLLVSAALLLGVNISALRGNLGWMEHSQAVLTHLDRLEAAVLSDEMTVRGYALTGDAQFLEFQQKERGRCTIALIELKRLEGERPHRMAEFTAVDKNTHKHLDIFGSLDLKGPNRASVVAHAIVDPGVRENMRATRRAIDALRIAELSDLAARQRDVTHQIARAFFLAIGIIVVAFILGGVGVWAAQIKAPLSR